MLHSVLSLSISNAGTKGRLKAKSTRAATIEQAIGPGSLAMLLLGHVDY